MPVIQVFTEIHNETALGFKKRLTLLSDRSNLYLFNFIEAFMLNLLSGGTIFDKATLSWGEF